MQKRTPVMPIILGALVVIAIIWRIANPSQPPTPGPFGAIPNWRSLNKLGDMGPWQVNPSGTMWAGAWSLKEKDGKERSAVWVIDLEKQSSVHKPFNGESIYSIGWKDNNTLWVLYPKGDGAATRTVGLKVTQDGLVEQSIADTRDSKAVKGYRAGMYGSIPAFWAVSKDESITAFATKGTHNADEKPSVFVLRDYDVIGRFETEQLPGKLEGMWISPKSVLFVCSEHDKFDRAIYDITTKKLTEIKPKDKINLVEWLNAPKDMMFVSYNAGYKFNLASGKTTKLFDFAKTVSRPDEEWRREVQDGRLYLRKNSGYTSISHAAGAIDIRTLKKDGSKDKVLLPRS